MRALAFLAAACFVAGLTLLLPETPRVVTASEAAFDVGGVNLDDFRCIPVTTCDVFNQFAGSVHPCPNEPAKVCSFCSNGDKTLYNCVRSTGQVCQWQPPSRSNCGVLQIGGCVGTECVMSFTTGMYCAPGTGCRE